MTPATKLSTIGLTAAIVAVMALALFASGQANPVGATHNDADVYTPGTESYTLSGNTLPDLQGCNSHYIHEVELRQAWLGDFPPEAKEFQSFAYNDAFPDTLTLSNLDKGGAYRARVKATCQTSDTDPELSATGNWHHFNPGGPHHGGWFYAQNDGDDVKYHVHPATICDNGYMVRSRARGSDPWTETRLIPGMAQPQSNDHPGFIVFTKDSLGHDRAKLYCVWDVRPNGNLKLAMMSSDFSYD